ncbi:hypothetical protein BDA96_03G079000 [Sorghum bicolor]|uniref:Replication factor A C-terminal domain-containing protein n=1 Tax=Sorghum bicolor TaxID=4558 RepID=A0A921RCP5_SORBI|nr:replication protein A 70 kDa DNA-binding subunit E isoform X2 [Sorghum bicolor]KAG0536617.1 hypothetical protein BDA96_03G079000 [Sorghum bicolor]|eukprot:XP_021311382.1 replication protein A 70 kDa DNA-binding subunit E isoform X2 [Sorghum bicolor]
MLLRKPPSLHQASPGLGMRTSLSPHAGMRGPSQGQGDFTPLSQLTLGYHGRSCRVLVRVSRIWVASNPITGEVYGLHCLLIDGEGVVMQACARPWDMERLKHQLVEGKVYALSNFGVREKLDKYMACSNGLVISMGAQTVVNEITDHAGSSIPLHSFEFVDFGDLPSRNNDRSLFTDVIGQIVSIEDEGWTWKWGAWRNISFRNIHLRDLGGKQLNVTLFGDLGSNFDAEQVFKQGQKVPVVAIFAGMLVEHYKGFIVRSTSASKYYLDLDVEEVQKFRASLDGPYKPIDRLPCRLQKPLNPTELIDSWRTIKQLRNLNSDELQRTWLCRATLKGIDSNKGWSYQSCFHCHHSVSWDGSKFLCNYGCPNNKLSVRYKLDAVIKDETDSMNVMIFDGPAQKLVGVPAEELNGEVTGDDISAVISSQHRRAFVMTSSAVIKFLCRTEGGCSGSVPPKKHLGLVVPSTQCSHV